MQFLERRGRYRLGFRVDPAKGAARGRVLLIHGYADHAARFDHVAQDWNERGLTVARFDLTGHGTSGGPRGHIAEFDDYLADVRDVLAALAKEPSWNGTDGAPKKLVLFGHSMGALIALHTALLLGSDVAGVAATSPFLAPAKKVPAFQIALGRLVSRFAPGLRQPSGLRGEDMCHDAAVVARYDTDQLRFNHVTVGWFVAISRAQEELFARVPALRAPVYCIAAGDDRVVSLDATRRLFERIGSPSKELEVRDALFHEVLNEPDWREHSRKLAERMLPWASG
jgi:alpha-beta hydrolase superfamily lysophospholipase